MEKYAEAAREADQQGDANLTYHKLIKKLDYAFVEEKPDFDLDINIMGRNGHIRMNSN